MRVLLLMICSLIAVWAEDAMRSVPIPGTQLAIVVPATWITVSDQPGAVLVLRSPAPAVDAGDVAERARGIIAVALQPVKDEQPFAFFMRCRRDLERTVTGLQLDTPESIGLGGHSWTKLPYRMQVGQFTFSQVLHATVIAGTGICVTCSSSVEGMATWKGDFEAAIKSLGRSRVTIELK